MTKTKTAEKPESSWLDRLSELRSASDFENAIPGLEEARAAAVRRVDELLSEQTSAMFTGADLSALRRQITEARERVDSYDAAISGARTRREEAWRAELEEELASIKEDSARRAHIMTKAYEKVPIQTLALRESLATTDREHTAIENNNARMESIFEKLGRSKATLLHEQTNTKTIKRLALGMGGAPGADILPNISRGHRPTDEFLRDLALFRRQAAAPSSFGNRGV